MGLSEYHPVFPLRSVYRVGAAHLMRSLITMDYLPTMKRPTVNGHRRTVLYALTYTFLCIPHSHTLPGGVLLTYHGCSKVWLRDIFRRDILGIAFTSRSTCSHQLFGFLSYAIANSRAGCFCSFNTGNGGPDYVGVIWPNRWMLLSNLCEIPSEGASQIVPCLMIARVYLLPASCRRPWGEAGRVYAMVCPETHDTGRRLFAQSHDGTDDDVHGIERCLGTV